MLAYNEACGLHVSEGKILSVMSSNMFIFIGLSFPNCQNNDEKPSDYKNACVMSKLVMFIQLPCCVLLLSTKRDASVRKES